MKNMPLFDMHSHILAGVDDGARTVSDSVKLLNCLKEQGICNVCLTPHFYSNEQSVNDFVTKRNKAFELLKDSIPDGINVVLGAEVFVCNYMFGNNDLSSITYGNSKFILAEFSYDAHFSDHTMSYFIKIKENYRLNPVLTHVERYSALMKDKSLIRELKDMGVIIQTNISSYTKKTSMLKRRKMLKLVENDYIDILGSDAHSFRHSSPVAFTEAMNTIIQYCGEKKLEEMMGKSKQIFDESFYTAY